MSKPKPCTKCGQTVHWPDPYFDGCKLLNGDESQHNCLGSGKSQEQTQLPTPQGDPPPTPQPKIVGYTVLTPEQIIKECETFHIAFKDRTDVQFDALARIYISRMMSNRR